MKYEVTYSCGHTGTVELFGTSKERERKINWYQTCAICPDCYKASKEEQIKETEQENNFPELAGTPKQVSWAKSIREKMFAQIKENYARFYEEIEKNPLHKSEEEIKKLLEEAEITKAEFKRVFDNETNASFWIDHRDIYCMRLVQNYNKSTQR